MNGGLDDGHHVANGVGEHNGGGVGDSVHGHAESAAAAVEHCDCGTGEQMMQKVRLKIKFHGKKI